MISIRDLANRELLDLVPYEPGKPIDDVARELGIEPASIIKLASNENPLGPSPKAVEAMLDALTQVHIYPDGGGYHLRTALAEKLGLARENVVIGNGSNEIIELMFHSFTRPGVHDIITARNAFVVYKLMAQLFGVRAIEVPDRGFVPDLRAMRAAITPQTRLLFIASPNNPTGTRVPNEDLEELIDHLPDHVIAVMDEAYFEFMDSPPDSLAWVKKGKKVVLMRTFSKIQGLAGLRIGYGLASAELAGILQRARQPFNTNSLAQVGALAALRDQEHQDKTKQITDEGRARMEKQFADWRLSYVPSAANFVLVDVGDGDAVFKKLMKLGIIVRSMVSYRLPSYIRVSIGTPEQNERFLRELPGVMDRPLPSPVSVAAEAEVARVLEIEGPAALGTTATFVGAETEVSDPPYIPSPASIVEASSAPVAEAAPVSVAEAPPAPVVEALAPEASSFPVSTPPPLPSAPAPKDSASAWSDAEPVDSMTPRLLEEEKAEAETPAAPSIPLVIDEEERVAAAVAHEEDVKADAPAQEAATEFEEVPIITSNLIGLVPEAPGEKILDDEPRHAFATGLVPTPREVAEAINELAAEAPAEPPVTASPDPAPVEKEDAAPAPKESETPAETSLSVTATAPESAPAVGETTAAIAEEPKLPLTPVTPLLTPYEDWHASPVLTAPKEEEIEGPPALGLHIPHDEADELLPEGKPMTPRAEAGPTLPIFEPLLADVPHEMGHPLEAIPAIHEDRVESVTPAAHAAIGDAPPLLGGESSVAGAEVPQLLPAPVESEPSPTPSVSGEGHGHGGVSP